MSTILNRVPQRGIADLPPHGRLVYRTARKDLDLAYQVFPEVTSPVFILDATGYYVVDSAVARKMLRNRLVAKNGQRMGTFTDGKRKWVTCVPVFVSRRYKPKPQLSSGESAHMSPSRPTRGAVWSSGYARRLSGLVSHHPDSVALFNGWKPKVKVTPIQADANTVKDRAILYFPLAGMTTAETQALRASRRKRV